MNELDVILRKNKLDIMIIKASHHLEKKKDKVKQEGLEVLLDILELIHELQDEVRQQRKQIAKLKYENAVSSSSRAACAAAAVAAVIKSRPIVVLSRICGLIIAVCPI